MRRLPTPEALLSQESRALYEVMTVSEVAEEFHLVGRANIILACITGRVASRKADVDEGKKGGIWLISRSSAMRIWGHRK